MFFFEVLKSFRDKLNFGDNADEQTYDDFSDDDEEDIYVDGFILTLSPKNIDMTLDIRKRKYEEEQYKFYGVHKEFKADIL